MGVKVKNKVLIREAVDCYTKVKNLRLPTG